MCISMCMRKTETGKRDTGKRQVIRTKMDSGACDSVANFGVGEDYPIVETKESKNQVFQSATGDTMPNHGERTLLVKTASGKLKALKKQICDCTGPLTSIPKTCDNNHFVGLGKTGGFILDLRDQSIEWIDRNDDAYEMELEIIPYDEAKPLLEKAGF